MFSVKVSPDMMHDRLDAGFYRPDYLELENVLSERGAVTLGVLTDGVECGPFGGNAIADDLYSPEGVAFIRPVNISSDVFDQSSLVRVPEKLLIENNLKVYKGTNLYFGRVGNPCVAVIDAKTSISPNIILAKTNVELADPYYLYAFSACGYGIKQLLRQLKTVAQPTTSTEAVRNLTVLAVAPLAQKYIGDKVRQAEQLRAWAKALQVQANQVIPSYTEKVKNYTEKSFRAKSVSSARLDSQFYHPDFIALDKQMESVGCKPFGRIVKQIKDGWNKSKAVHFYYYEIGGLNVSNGQVEAEKTLVKNAPSRAKTKVLQGDVLVSTVRPNRKNVGFIIDNLNDAEMVGTSGFSVLRFDSLSDSAFYHAWLRTDDATAQLMRWNSGSAYPAIDDDVPLQILVPEFEQDFKDLWGKKLLGSHLALLMSKELTSAAKLLVEALIEGHLTEQQLIDAQQALEMGDNSLDRAILAGLTPQSFNADPATNTKPESKAQSQALFNDLDELYNLLAQANEAAHD